MSPCWNMERKSFSNNGVPAPRLFDLNPATIREIIAVVDKSKTNQVQWVLYASTNGHWCTGRNYGAHFLTTINAHRTYYILLTGVWVITEAFREQSLVDISHYNKYIN